MHSLHASEGERGREAGGDNFFPFVRRTIQVSITRVTVGGEQGEDEEG